MKTTTRPLIFLIALSFFQFTFILPQNTLVAQQTQWCLSIGGTGDEQGRSMVQTADSGYVIAGYTTSFGAGGYDVYVVKLTKNYTIQWTKTIGGTGTDWARSIIQTKDGGYAIAGWTNSFGQGVNDFYIIKLDAQGAVQWTKTVGGTGDDLGWSIIQTADDGYAIAGQTSSFGSSPHDVYVVKLDNTGAFQWDRKVGVSGTADIGYSIVQSADGGYVICGTSYTFTGNVSTSSVDYYIVKLDVSGGLVWSRVILNPRNDYARTIIKTQDGGFLVAGERQDPTTTNWDIYIVKLDASGVMQWDRSYGMSNSEEGFSVVETSDGGFVVTGSILPSSPIANTWYDLYLVKFDRNGTPLWNRLYGTTLFGSGGSSGNLADYNVGYSIVETFDKGLAISGYLGGGNSGVGNQEIYFLKLDDNGGSCCSNLVGGNARFFGATTTTRGTSAAAGGISSTGGVIGAGGGSIYDFCNISFQASATAVDANCYGDCSGSATANTINGTGPFSYIWSTTPAQTSSTATGLCAGNYSVTITDNSTNATSTATATVGEPSQLSASVVPTNVSCGSSQGEAEANPTGGTGPYSYSWNTTPVQTTKKATGLSSGNYIVTVTDAKSCTVSASITITSTSITAPVISADDSLICASDSAKICAPNTFANYLWNTGDTTACIFTRLAGGYWVNVTDINGCTATSTRQNISVYPATSVSIIRQGDTLSSFGALSYQWLKNGIVIPGATGQVYVVDGPGTYYVQITDANGCKSTSTGVVITGLNDLEVNSGFYVYPNPTEGILNITVSPDWVGKILEIYNALGQIIWSEQIHRETMTVHLGAMAPGVYMAKVDNAAIKFLKQ